MEVDLLDRYKGTLVGVHVGDSIGAPYETWSPKQIAKDIKERGGLTFFDYKNPWPNDDNGEMLPAGRPTDDSDQTADLAYSLVVNDGLDTEHLRESLRDSVLRGKSRLWDGQATGSGRTTRNALGVGLKTSKLNGVPINNIGTNGSLMRCSPMAMWIGPSMGLASVAEMFENKQGQHLEVVADMSRVTHAHQYSIQACQAYTLCLTRILNGLRFEDFEDGLKSLAASTRSRMIQRVLLRLNDELDFPYDPGAWPMRGTAEFSLYVALYAFLKSESFAEGIEIAVRVGGDTDTYAAIAGGLLGAHYGYEAIPEDWRKTILGHDVMVEYAEKLYIMRLCK